MALIAAPAPMSSGKVQTPRAVAGGMVSCLACDMLGGRAGLSILRFLRGRVGGPTANHTRPPP